MVACMRRALQESGLTPADVDYVNAHATSTRVGDIAEIRALEQLFNDGGDPLITATKSMIGHSLGAAGALEAIATIQALRYGAVHPTINCSHPETTRLTIATRAISRPLHYAISNSFGFGGHNSSLVFGRYPLVLEESL